MVSPLTWEGEPATHCGFICSILRVHFISGVHEKITMKKTGRLVWLRPHPDTAWNQRLPNCLKYHLWRAGPDAVRSLCGSMKALEGKAMLRPADSEQDAQDWSLCVRCRDLIPQEVYG